MTSSEPASATARSAIGHRPLKSADDQSRRVDAHRDRLAGREGAVAVAQQDRHRVVHGIGDGQVEPTVIVEVGGDHCDLRRVRRAIWSGWPEGAAALVEQDGDAAGLVGRHGDIEPAVAAEVGDSQIVRLRPARKRDRREERAVAAAQEQREIVAADVARDDVELAVAIEVGQNDGIRRVADGVCPAVAESAVAIAQQDRDVRGVLRVGVGDDQVGNAVAGEVTDRQP